MHKFRVKFQYTAFILIALLVMPCSCSDNSNKTSSNENIDSIFFTRTNVVKINDRLFGIPSPFQTSAMVKKLKVPFNKELLNPIQKQADYSTTFKQAINLGIYGADLSYLNIYEQTPYVSSYISTIKQLSKELGILSSIDELTLELIEQNKNNSDSLMSILADMFRNTDAYLFNNDRNDIGLLILSGGWIESLYIMTQTIKQGSNQEIINRIGEQKQPLNNLIELNSPYYEQVSLEFDNLLSQLSELATVFDSIQFEYKYKKSVVDTVNRITHVNSTRQCIISNEQLQQITQKIESIRNKAVE